MRSYQPGESGNIEGRPLSDFDLRLECRKHARKAVQVLLNIMNDEKVSVTASANAAKELLDRGYGKAPQAHTGEDGGPLQHKHTHTVSDEDKALIREYLTMKGLK